MTFESTTDLNEMSGEIAWKEWAEQRVRDAEKWASLKIHLKGLINQLETAEVE